MECGAHDVSRLMDSYSKHDYFDGSSLIMSICEMKSESEEDDENAVLRKLVNTNAKRSVEMCSPSPCMNMSVM